MVARIGGLAQRAQTLALLLLLLRGAQQLRREEDHLAVRAALLFKKLSVFIHVRSPEAMFLSHNYL